MSAESIKVCMRFRKEPNIPEKEFAKWEFSLEENKVSFGEKKWTYDHLLVPETEQEEMFDKVGKQTITDFLKGYNGTIFAYGQSGSGKTFSMLGPEDVTNALAKDFNSVPEEVTKLYGITPRAVIQIFQTINEYVRTGNECTLHCSYIEIYNEQINCLLNRKENLKIREHPVYGMYVAEKETRICKTPEEIFEVISIATKNRAVAGTNQNARSSRSHTILLIELEYNGLDGIKRTSKLNLVDLAGSERIAKTGAEGQRLKEAQKINQSLTTLGMCIMALTTPNSKHIPYRNSKLTLILKESLGGSAKTTLLCTASRLMRHEEESIQTLYFASRAKSIKNVCKVNMTLGTKELQYLADHLKKEIMVLRGQLKKANIKWNKITDPKLLSFISNELEGEDGDNNKDEDKKDDPRRKRASLIGLTEEEIIFKYIEIRNKYDSLLDNAREKIFKLENAPRESSSNMGYSEENINQIKEEAAKQIEDIQKEKQNEIDKLTHVYENEKNELNTKITLANESISAITSEKNTLETTIQKLKDSIEEYKAQQVLKEKEVNDKDIELKNAQELNENAQAKVSTFLMEIEEKEEIISQLKETNSKLENENTEHRAKLVSIENELSLNKIELSNLKQLVSSKTETETSHIQTIDSLQRNVNDLLLQLKKKEEEILIEKKQHQDNTLKYQSQIDTLISKEKLQSTQYETLSQEKDKLTKMLNEKISAQDMLLQKEKIENEARMKLELKLKETINENNKLINELNENKSQLQSQQHSYESQIEAIQLEKRTNETSYQTKLINYDNTIKSLNERIQLENQNNEKVTERMKVLESKIKQLESQGLTLKHEKDVLESKYQELSIQFEKKEDEMYKHKIANDKLNVDINALKANINDINALRNKEKDEYNSKEVAMLKEIENLKSLLLIKDKQIESDKIREKELKQQITAFQSTTKNMQIKIDKLSLENNLSKKQQNIVANKSNAIKKQVPISKNIFGVVLKKVEGPKDYLQIEKDQFKVIEERAKEIFKDNEMFKDLRKNIITLSPETVSSRDDMADLPEIDFANEETYIKAEQEMLEKEKIHQAKKEKEKLLKQSSLNNNNKE